MNTDNNQKKNFLFSLLFGIAYLLPMAMSQAHSAAKTLGPQEVVESSSQALVAGLIANHEKIKSTPYLAYELAEETVLPHMDLQRIAQIVLGKRWRNATAEQRVAFTNAFTIFVMNTYVTAMMTFSDEIIDHADQITFPAGKSKIKSNKAMIVSNVKLASGVKAVVSYRLSNKKGTWKIYDVVIEGISLAITYRNNFNSEISRSSLDALIVRLEEKNKTAEQNFLKLGE